MFISVDLAKIIVKRAMAIIHHNVNVMDHNGIIIASGEANRIGELHGIACEVIRTRRRIVVDEIKESDEYQNVQMGINHPIIIDDQVILVIGVSGNPAVIGRYAELAILTAELLIQQAYEIRKINWQYRIRDLLFKQFIEGTDDKSDEALTQLNLFGVDLHKKLQPILINVKISGNQQDKAIDHIINVISSLTNFQSVILLSNEEILLILDNENENIIQKIDNFLVTQLSHYRIAVGIKTKKPQFFRKSVAMLKKMIDLNIKSSSKHKIITPDNFVFQSILDNSLDNPFVLFFNEKMEKLLTSSLSDSLIETLEVYINCNNQIAVTAEKLDIHRNTLLYRLKKIKEISQLDPLNFMELNYLMIGLYYYKNTPIPI